MAVFRVGDIIKKKRQELHISQEELSYGICSTVSLSNIERNLQTPSKTRFDALMQRMGQRGEPYYSFEDANEYEIHKKKKAIRRLMYEQRFEEAEKIIVELDKKMKTIVVVENINQQFVVYQKAMIKIYHKMPLEEILDMLRQAIQMTVPGFEETDHFRFFLTYEELLIIYETAKVYRGMSNFKKAAVLLRGICTYIDERYVSMEDRVKVYPFVLRDLTDVLLLEKCYEETVLVCNKGIQVCVEYGKMQSFPDIIFNKAKALMLDGKRKESISYFRQAYYIQKAMKEIEKAEVINKYAERHGIGKISLNDR